MSIFYNIVREELRNFALVNYHNTQFNMKRYMTTLVLAIVAAQSMDAQNVWAARQDSLLQMMNDSTYWKQYELDEAVVKGNLPKTRVKGDAMRTVVSGSVLEKAGTLTDVLGKIPTLKAEKGSGVEVFGRGAAEVYINGRKVMDMNELDRLRSEDIQSVDVIHNPGARYAAETKAVVRITMKKRQGEGFSFVDYASGIYRYGASGANNLDMNYRTGGLDVTASFWCGHYGHNRGNASNDITYLVGNDKYVGRSTQNSSYRWNGYSPQLQLNYMLSENHSFGAFYKWDHNTKNKHDGWFNMDNYKNDVLEESMLSDLCGDDWQKKHIFNAYYNGKVHNLSIDWNVDGLFSNQDGWSETTETTTYADSKPATISGVKSFNFTSNDFWATKLVLSYPVWKGNLSAGAEYTHNSRSSSYTVNTEAQVATTNSDIDIRETSASGFVEYGRAFKSLFVQAGLRYEHIDNDYYVFDVRQDDTSRSYGDFFPTATLAYRTPHQVQLSLSYRKDIRRPAYDNLGSSIIYINKYSYQGGNPYLQPVYTHNITLNAAYKWANAMLNLQRIENDIVLQTKPFYSFGKQGAPSLSGKAGGEANPMVSIILPENSAEAYNRLFLSLSARPVIGVWHPAWTASLSFQNYKTLTLDGSTITLNHPYAWFVWDNDFILSHDWRINAQLQYGTKGDYMTYRMVTNNWNSNIGIQKDIKTRRLGKFNFDLRCYDPFNIAKTGSIVYGIRQIESHNPARRTIMLDITWRFNEAQKKYRGSGAGQSQKDRM